MTFPTDGFGIYENINTLSNSATYQPRLDQIASGGFKLVLNYGLLHGHIADVIAYINYAASKGLKVIVSIENVAIWKTGAYTTGYPELYADSGNAATGIAFMQYVVGQIKNLAGVWGWYVCDEVVNADHTALKAYCDAVATADSTHPRLVVESGTGTNFWNNVSTQWDCGDVIADDYYPLNYTSENLAGHTEAFTGTVAAGIQTRATAHSLQSGIVLQAFNANLYANQICSPWPTCATTPSYADMNQVLQLALANMTPRVVLWFSYHDILRSDNPTQHWNDLTALLANIQNKKFALFAL